MSGDASASDNDATDLPHVTEQQLAEILKNHGFVPADLQNFCLQWCRPPDHTLYIKPGTKKLLPGLVLAPGYDEFRSELLALDGTVVRGGFYFSSGMPKFPAYDQTGNGKLKHYGFLIGFTSTTAADAAVSALTTYQDQGIAAARGELAAVSTPLTPNTRNGSSSTQRIGQREWRNKLLGYWRGCSVTAISRPAILRASHIKPWSDSKPTEQVDLYNGLLLLPNLDVLFDRGLVTFTLRGKLLASSQLNDQERHTLGLSAPCYLRNVDKQHEPYLSYHLTHIFQS